MDMYKDIAILRHILENGNCKRVLCTGVIDEEGQEGQGDWINREHMCPLYDHCPIVTMGADEASLHAYTKDIAKELKNRLDALQAVDLVDKTRQPEVVTKKSFSSYAIAHGLVYMGSQSSRTANMLEWAKTTIDGFDLPTMNRLATTKTDKITMSGTSVQRHRPNGGISYLDIAGKRCTVLKYGLFYIVWFVYTEDMYNSETVVIYYAGDK